MKTLLVYGTLGCHLCEQALELITPLLVDYPYSIEEVDISESDELIELYGIRIPVIRRPDTETELGWPFDQLQLITFLN